MAGAQPSGSREFGENVRLWDAVMLASADRPLPGAVLEQGSVLRPPAPAATVEAAARGVGGALPASCPAFLTVSDGADANGCGVVTRPG